MASINNQAREEVLRYLGRRGQEVPPQLDTLIEECLGHMAGIAPRHVDRTYDLLDGTDVLSLQNTRVTLPGRGIRRHLGRCRQVVLLAVTLGVAADNLIRRWESIDITRALVLDACATQHIERACDEIEERIDREAQEKGLMFTTRFSPGYSDLPLDIQPYLLAALDTERRIGLTCTPNMILLPHKSVTALIGLGENIQADTKGCGETEGRKTRCDNTAGCAGCNLNQTCSFRKE